MHTSPRLCKGSYSALGRSGITFVPWELQTPAPSQVSPGGRRCHHYHVQVRSCPKDGKRQDAAHAYLHPRLQDGDHPNLHVLVGSQVTRVILDEGKRATGVEFRPNPELMDDPTAAKPATGAVRTRKMVVVTAGAFGSPAILERSGIGDREVLQHACVPIVAHLPGVGHGCQDHQTSLYTYKADMPPEDSWESIYNGTRQIPELLANNDKILSWNGVDAAAKIRPTATEVDSLEPRFRQAWDQDFKDIKSKPLISMILVTGILGDPTPFPPDEYFTICTYTTYPYSRGHVHITGPNIDEDVDFKTGYLSDADDIDLKAQVWAYKKQRRVAQGMRFFGGDIPEQHPAFPEGSKVSSLLEETGGNGSTIDGEYRPEDDVAIEDFLRTRVGTTWHPLGTCKMASVQQMGVVDENLSLYGVKGLKVADLSIAPKNVAGNTMSTALMIGERAADIFIRELCPSRC
ncbi:hypothetical protein F5883DRAFT_421663 [Diaporthe sp. PMI_573]|nr:hypothetical protein F5883DRAFT_421663 [Diaporthaceae sp. PMI_573]